MPKTDNIQFIKNLDIIFVKSYKKTKNYFPDNQYLQMAPFIESKYLSNYLPTQFYRKDTMTYIKHRYSNKWLYENTNNTLIFSYLQRNYNGFTNYKQPLVLFTDYLEEPTFILYTQKYYGNPYKLYLIYFEYVINNHKHIILSWSENPHDATIFIYDDPSPSATIQI